MVDLQNISSQLMKPCRELASWNFSFSEILEEYFNSLPEPCKIHYGEAALVIQNSVHAYVRRVEELYDETKCFCQKIRIQSNEEEKKRKNEGLKRNLIDLSQFEAINFEKDIGKNIQLKYDNMKTISLLYRCFSQLKNSSRREHIQVMDIQDEVIGKKYDFCCNQELSNNGTVIEEFTPKIFEDSKRKVSEDSDVQIEEVVTSKEIESIDIEIYDTESPNEQLISENLQNSDDDSSDNVYYDFNADDEADFDSAVEQTQEKEGEMSSVESNTESAVEQTQEKEGEISSIETNTDDSETCVNNNTANVESKRQEIETKIDSVEKNGTDSFENNVESSRNKRKRTESNSNDEKDSEDSSIPESTKKLKETEDNIGNSTRKSKRLLEPMAFKNGVAEKLLRNRKEFKLPCHISLLKNSPKKRKLKKKQSTVSSTPRKNSSNQVNDEKTVTETLRKSSSNSVNDQIIQPETPRKNLPNHINDEIIETENIKLTMYSPSRPLFESSQKDDLRNFRRNFTVDFEPVITVTTDLLGFQSNSVKKDADLSCTEDNSKLPECPSTRSSSPDDFMPCMTSPVNLKPSFMNFDQINEKINVKPSNGLEKMIKTKIKKIHEELDIQTDEDKKIAKWHAELKPKLEEAERKPPFRIHEYEARIIHRLEEYDRKLQFDEIVREESPSEIARYFSAALQLASTNNLNISAKEDIHNSIELILLD